MFEFAQRRPVALVLPALLAAAPAAAQDVPAVHLEASTRARVEAIDGQFRPGIETSTTFVSFRTTVGAKIDIGDFRLAGEIIDARGYGEGDHSSVKATEVNALEPVQAYAAYTLHGVAGRGDALTVTGGRFTMNLGSSRLVARTDFPNTAQSYLGVMTEYRTRAKAQLTLFWTRPFQALPTDIAAIEDNRVELDRAGGNMTFWGVHGTTPHLAPKISLEGYFYRLTEEDRGGRLTRNRRLSTFGARLRQAPAKGQFDFEVEAALQRGTARATTAKTDLRDLPVDAGFVHAELGWTLAGGWTPRVSALFDYASGTSSGSNYDRFDSLFGARRADCGPVALFGPVGLANIVSPGVRIEAKPSKRFDLMGSVRDLWLAEASDSFASTGVRDKAGASGRHAGVQFELRARRWLLPEKWRLELGAAYLAKGQFLHRAPGSPQDGDTRYVHLDTSWKF